MDQVRFPIVKLLTGLMILWLASRAEAYEGAPLVVWDGSNTQIDIKTKQLESLGSEPVLPHFDGPGASNRIGALSLRAPLKWFRLTLENRTSDRVSLDLVSIDPATHNLVIIQTPTQGSTDTAKEWISRRDTPAYAQDRLTRINLAIAPGLHVYYLGTSSYLNLQNFQLVYPEVLKASNDRFLLVSGLLLGGILIMTLTALIVYVGSGHQSLLFYAVYALTLLPLLLIVSGLLGVFCPSNIADWWERHLSLAIHLSTLGLMEFSLSVLNLKKLYTKIYTVLRVQSGLAFLLALISSALTSDHILFGVTQVTSFVAIASLLSYGLRRSKQDLRSTWFYLAGLGCFLLGATVALLGSFDIDIPYADPALSLTTGALLQFGFLPFSLRGKLLAFASEKSRQEIQVRELHSLIHILTHDLSGPLFVIQSMAELQESKSHQDAKVKLSFEKIKLAALSAQAMLKTVKELEAIEAGKLDLILRPVPILAILQSTVDNLKPRAEAKNLKLAIQSQLSDEDCKKVSVFAERTVLEHTVFHNLLSNAIKFSKSEDTITISIEILDDDRIVVRVKDQGIGIPKTLIMNLFSHNAKTSRKGTAGEKGTGLGLPLARRYVRKFGGDIEVQSQALEEFPADHWTQFTVILKKAG